METRKPSIFSKRLVSLAYLFLSSAIAPVCSGASSKYDFLQSRPEKGLLYYHNVTGNSNYDKGGSSLDVMRVMTDDVSIDFDERYPVLIEGEAENINVYSVGGDLLRQESFNDNSSSKRLGMRACCAGYFNKRRSPEISLAPEELDARVSTREVGENVKRMLDTDTVGERGLAIRDLESGQNIIGEFQVGPPRSTAWFIAASAATVGGLLSSLLYDLAKEVHNNGLYNNCFDKINTWLNDEYKISFQVRGSGNCGTTAETQTVYDALIDIVEKWRKEQRRRACAVVDHEGGGRLEFAMSATAQPAYELECGDKLFYACKGNENGQPTCDAVHSLRDTIE